MNTFVFAVVVLFAATNVLGQGYNEYVDEALIQKVGNIVYQYDQQQRSGGNVGSNNNVDFGRSVGYQQQQRVNNYVPQQQQQRVNYVPQQQQQRVNYVPQQQQQRNVYQSNRGQRQLTAPVQVQRQQVYQPQAPVPVARTYQTPQVEARRYETPRTSYPVTREYVQPQVVQQQQGSFSGYTLSEPEVIPRVAEFHFTDDEPQRSQSNQFGRSVSGFQQQRNNNRFQLA